MFSQVTYNVLIERFKAFAQGHYKIERFSHGQVDVTDIDKEQRFPWMHVVPVAIQPSNGSRSFTLDVLFADMPRDKENKTEYQRESLSDCIQLAEDLLAEIKNGGVVFGEDVTLEEGAQVAPFMEEYTHVLTGVTLSLTISFPWNWSACDIPADWTTGGSSSGGSGGGVPSLILKVNNVDNVIQDVLNLVNGTNTTIVDLGDGRVQINSSGGISSVAWGDIIGNIADQLDLALWFNEKADVSSLANVAFSGDYADLTNTPTIPPAQVNSDWNASSGVAEILNKPALATVATSGDYNDLINLPALPPTVGDMLKSVYDTDDDGVVDKAERIEIVVRNSTGSTLLKGQVVFLSGATGNRPNAILASATTEATSSKTIGFVVADIDDNADGNVAVNGTLHDLDTSAFNAGDTLWLSETDGNWDANTPPAEPAHAVFLGYVARSHPNLGRVVIQIQNGYELNELHGVKLDNVTEGNFFLYEAGLWRNRSLSASDIPSGIDATKIANGTISNSEFESLDGVSGNLQAQLNAKVNTNAAIVAGTATKISYDAKGLVTSGTSLVAADLPSGIDAAKIGSGVVSNSEFAFLDGVTSAIQTQINNLAIPAIVSRGTAVALVNVGATTATTVGLSINLVAGRTYYIEACWNLQPTFNPTGGARIGFSWSGTLTTFHGSYQGSVSEIAVRNGNIAGVTSGGLYPTNTPYLASDISRSALAPTVFRGYCTCDVNATLSMTLAAVTGGATISFAPRGSYLTAIRII